MGARVAGISHLHDTRDRHKNLPPLLLNVPLLCKIRGIREARISWLKVGEGNTESESRKFLQKSFLWLYFHSPRQYTGHEIAQVAGFCPLLLPSTD